MKTISTTEKLCAMIRERHKAGLKKYGVTVDRTDLTPEQWLQHSIEERIDDLQYMMRLKDEIAKMRKETEHLQSWKRQAMAVESEWDEQKIAHLLGGRLGESCRKVIMREVPKLVKKCKKDPNEPIRKNNKSGRKATKGDL